MERRSRFLRPLFGAVLFVGIIWFCFIAAIGNGSTVTRRATETQWKMIGREKHQLHWHSGINSVSKRRVPNGPDPIHNRREENSKQPPIRA